MREDSRNSERLAHILEAMKIVEAGIASYSRDELLNTPLLYYGLVKQIEIIGEAANMLTKDFRDSHGDVDWRPIVNMRHVLVHDYIHISKDILWETITRDLPELKPWIERYYSAEKKDYQN